MSSRQRQIRTSLVPILFGVFALLASACHTQRAHGPTPNNPQTGSDIASVPLLPPTETPRVLWDSLTAPSNVLINPPSFSGKVVRDALWVRFAPTASEQLRGKAITSVAGAVVGGRRVTSNDGYYLVRIPAPLVAGDSSSGPLLRAQTTLRAQAGVRTVLLVTLDQSP